MEILVQNGKQRLFLTTEGKWTSKRKEAVSFSSTIKALDYCFAKGVTGVRLLYWFRDQALDFVLSPFSDQETSTAHSHLQSSAYRMAQNRQLHEESGKVCRELDSIIAEGKERRKKRSFQKLLAQKPTVKPEAPDLAKTASPRMGPALLASLPSPKANGPDLDLPLP